MISGDAYCGEKVDIWSCGVILYALLCGFLPFEDPDTALLYKKILSGKYDVPEELIKPEAADLLSLVLEKDPAKRISLDEIREHVWFTSNNTPIQLNTGIFVGYSSVDYDNKVLDLLESGEGYPRFEREHVMRCLDANKHNSETTCYYLLLSKFGRMGE